MAQWMQDFQRLHSKKSSEVLGAAILFLLDGVDAILLETYYDLDELKTVLKILRETTDLPVVANVSMHEPGILQNGKNCRMRWKNLLRLERM